MWTRTEASGLYYHRENNFIRKFELVANKSQLLFYEDQIDFNKLM